MSQQELKEKLALFSPLQVDIRINDNISTYLSVLKKSRKKIKLSLHKLFLQAPEDICEAIMHYCLYRDNRALQLLKGYSHNYFLTADYSDKVNLDKLETRGRYVDLQEIYDRLNLLYFQQKVDVKITWFPKPKYRNYRSITFGSYNRSKKLIRINKILDSPKFPLYFTEFILYHEMLHDICPPEIDRAGRVRVHTSFFRKKEKEFHFYQKAIDWENKYWK